jgi:hypothetical protein
MLYFFIAAGSAGFSCSTQPTITGDKHAAIHHADDGRDSRRQPDRSKQQQRDSAIPSP